MLRNQIMKTGVALNRNISTDPSIVEIPLRSYKKLNSIVQRLENKQAQQEKKLNEAMKLLELFSTFHEDTSNRLKILENK